MEEIIDNEQKFDFNTLEHLRDSEIPLEKNKQIKFTLEIPISQNKKKQVEMNECIMSKAKLFSGLPTKFYTCPLCSYTPEGEKICEYCFLNCHSGHGNIEDLEPLLFTLNDNYCSCAKNNHSLSLSKKKLLKRISRDQCFFIKIHIALKLNAYVKFKGKFYCFGCFKHCLKNKIQSKEDYEIFYGELKSCHCQECLNLPKSKPIEVLYNIITDEENTCDLSGALYNLVSNPEMNRIFILPLIILFNSLSSSHFSKGRVIDDNIKSDEINLRIFKALIKKYKHDDVMIIDNLSDIINSEVISHTDSKTYQNANTILNIPFFKYYNLLEIKESSPYILCAKYYALFLLRKLFILPATGIKKNFAIVNKINIITAFHRIYCRMTKDQFFENLISYGCDVNLFDKIINHYNLRTKLYPNRETFLYIKENLKWYLLILSIEYPNTEEQFHFISNIIGKIMIILDNIKENKIFEKEENKEYAQIISYYIQKIVVVIILSLNDKDFKQFIIEREKEIPFDIEKEKMSKKFFFSKDGILKEQFTKILKILFFSDDNLNISYKIYNSFLSTRDLYITSLEHFSGCNGGNKQKISTKMYRFLLEDQDKFDYCLTDITDLIDESKNAKTQYYRNGNFEDFSSCFIKNLNDILIESEKYRNFIDPLDKSNLYEFNKKCLQHLYLVKSGFFNDLLSLYDFYKKAFLLNQKLKNIGEKKDYKDVQAKIFEIVGIFSNNSFVFPIFLTKKFLKIIVKYDIINKCSYLGNGEIKFYCQLLKEVEPLSMNNDFCYLLSAAVNVKFDDNYEKMCLLFKLFKYIIRQNCSETLMTLNQDICNYLENNNYQQYFPNNNKEEEDFTGNSEIKFKPLERKKAELMISILKVINLFDDYNYCIFAKKFPIDSIEQLIKGYQNEILICNNKDDIAFYEKILRVCSYAYAKFYVISPFKIYEDTCKNKEYDKYMEGGYPIVFEKEDLHNLVRKPLVKYELGEELDKIDYFNKNNISPITTYDFWRLSPEIKTNITEKISLETIFDFLNEKDKFLESWGNGETYIISKETNGIYYKKHSEILNVLITNMEMGGIQLRNLKDRPKSFFKHFEKTILIPTLYMIYHCLYYIEINSNQKYLIYKILILFLKCYKEFLQLIIDKIMDFARENLYHKFKKKENKKAKFLSRSNKIQKTLFTNENEKKLEILIQDFFIIEDYQQDIKIYLLNTRDCVDIDINLIGKNPLDTILLLKKFTKYITKLKKANFTKVNEDSEQIFLYFINSEENKVATEIDKSNIERKQFLEHMTGYINLYKELKKDMSQNIFLKNISNPHGGEYEVFHCIFKDILFKLINKTKSETKKEEEPYYLRINYLSNFELFNALIIQNPSLFQDFLINEDKSYVEKKKIEKKISSLSFNASQFIQFDEKENKSNNQKVTKLIIEEIVSQLKILFQYILIDYQKFQGKQNNEEPLSVKRFINLLEFLRLLCENHNQIYQLLLSTYPIDVIKDEEDNKNIYGLTLPQFLLQIPPLSKESIDLSNNKKKYISYFKDFSNDFFNSLNSKVTDFLVEMIQGSKSSSILKTSNLYFLFYLIMGDSLMDTEIKLNVEFLNEFFRFMVCYVEENAIELEEKQEVINFFNARKLVFYLADCVKMLYHSIPVTPELKEAEKTKSYHEILNEEFLLNTEFFINDNKYFNISCYVCKFLNFAASFGNAKIAKLLNEFEGVKNQDKLDQKALWRRESTLFFNKLLRKVDINQVFTYIEPNNEEIIVSDYSKFENMIEIRDDGTNEEFVLKHTKDEKSDLSLNARTTTYIGTLNRRDSLLTDIKIKDIESEYKDKEKSPSMTTIFICHPDVLLLDNKDFIEFENFAPYDSLQGKLTYLLQYIPKLIEKIDYKKSILKKKNKLYEALSNIDYFKFLQISASFSLLINSLLLLFVFYDMNTFSTNKMIIERHSNLIFIIEIIHLLFLFLVLLNWFFFREFFLINVKKKHSVSRKELLYSLLFEDINLSLLVWNFFWGILAAFTPSFHFAYSFQLFSIFACFETMKTVFTSVQMRVKQFMAAGLLILIFSLFFTGIKFQYFCDDTNEECQHFFNCYLSMITLGIRAGNGLGLNMKSINSPGYFTEFLIEWLFYFLIILVMLNIINGIIVDTFQEQREKNNIRNDAKINRCFICHHDRQYIEKNGINSSFHMKVVHSYKSYFDYLISIQKQNKLDLNSLDYEIWKKMENEKTDFFPKNL